MEISERRVQLLRSIEMLKREKQKPDWSVYVLTAWTVALWLVGCALIGYMAWVLATSVTIKQFVSGKLVFTYTLIGLGFQLFTIGLLGWVGATSINAFILRVYITASVLALALEIGGFLALSILQVQIDDIIEHGWRELNQGTRNIVQQQLWCCGYTGPKEFAYRNDPIDDSCYETLTLPSSDASDAMDPDGSRLLKQYGCGNKLRDWFQSNPSIWVAVLSAIGCLELFGVFSAIHVVSKRKRYRTKQMAQMLDIENCNGYSD